VCTCYPGQEVRRVAVPYCRTGAAECERFSRPTEFPCELGVTWLEGLHKLQRLCCDLAPLSLNVHLLTLCSLTQNRTIANRGTCFSMLREWQQFKVFQNRVLSVMDRKEGCNGIPHKPAYEFSSTGRLEKLAQLTARFSVYVFFSKTVGFRAISLRKKFLKILFWTIIRNFCFRGIFNKWGSLACNFWVNQAFFSVGGCSL
jgi:hypothetical protein